MDDANKAFEDETGDLKRQLDNRILVSIGDDSSGEAIAGRESAGKENVGKESA